MLLSLALAFHRSPSLKQTNDFCGNGAKIGFAAMKQIIVLQAAKKFVAAKRQCRTG